MLTTTLDPVTSTFHSLTKSLEPGEFWLKKILQSQQDIDALLAKRLSLHKDKSWLGESYYYRTYYNSPIKSLTGFVFSGPVTLFVLLYYDAYKRYESAEGANNIISLMLEICVDIFPDSPKWRTERSVVMEFQGIYFELVPAFRTGRSSISFPDSKQQKWLTHNFIKSKNLFDKVDQLMHKQFRPLVRLVNFWVSCNELPLRQHHLDQILLKRYLKYTEAFSFDSMLCNLFQDLDFYIEIPALDVANNYQVDSYLSAKDRALTINTIRLSATKALLADQLYEKGDHQGSWNTWRTIFANHL